MIYVITKIFINEEHNLRENKVIHSVFIIYN